MQSIRSAKFHTEDGSTIRIISDVDDSIMPADQALLHGDFVAWLHSGEKIAPYYSIVAAASANAEGTAVRVTTLEAGDVLVTQAAGKSERWAALIKWVSSGGEIAPFRI